MESIEVFTFLGALGVVVVVTPLTIRLAHKLGLMDQPDARKVHTRPTPRLGGIAIAVGTLIPCLCASFYLQGSPDTDGTVVTRQLLAVAGAATFLFLVGLVDDIRSVSSRFKLLAIVAASLMVCGSGATLGTLRFGGEDVVQFQGFSWLVTTFWIVAVTVAINFIDGLDGLAAGVSLLAASILAYFLGFYDSTLLPLLPLALAGALAGFLVFNWHPARTFMGDGGSLTIGFLIGATSVIANPAIGTMRGVVLPALALSVPLADGALTFFRRHYLQRRSLFAAEQGHIHHQLLRRGVSHLQAVLVILLVSLLALAIGLIGLAFEGWGTLGGLSLIVPLLWGTFRFAGSIRTSEMMDALRNKRQIDRLSRRYRSDFELIQLEFAHVDSFAGWWQGVCRAAERLDFASIAIPVRSRDGSTRQLAWTTAADRFRECSRVEATVPIVDRRAGHEALTARIEVALPHSLELAGERLALFLRLMQEHGLASLPHRFRSANGRSSGAHQRNRGSQAVMPIPLCDGGPFDNLRVAIVHDFLYVYAGAERVLGELIALFPHGDLFALFDHLPEHERHFLRGKPVATSLLQNLPFVRTHHRAYLPLMPLAIEQLDVSDYDLVISSSYLAAKGVITGPDQLHVCYCHSPARYVWDLQHEYLKLAGLGYGVRGLVARVILHYIRLWDACRVKRIHFIANSQFVARRIENYYDCQATVIHAPVDVDFYQPTAVPREDYYLVVGRMVPYKRTDLIIGAFAKRPDLKLKVIGTGPEFDRLRRLAGPNVELIGYQDNATLRTHYQQAKALVFAAEEDFGIVPVEAMACGTPVIAYGKGGVTESVTPGLHGVMFDRQTIESLLEAIDRFEVLEAERDGSSAIIRQNAERFSRQRFRDEVTTAIAGWVAEKWPAREAAAADTTSSFPRLQASGPDKGRNGHTNGHSGPFP